MSQQFALPHWRCPMWFEIRLANDWPVRAAFCALFGFAFGAAAAAVLVFIPGGPSYYFTVLPLLTLAFAAFGFFVAAQRIAPGRTDVECRPLSLFRSTTKRVVGYGSDTTYWSDNDWPYNRIQGCAIIPPGQRYPFGVLVVCVEGEYHVMGIPAEFHLPMLAQFFVARGVAVKHIAEIQPQWIPSWQSTIKWIVAGVAAGAGLIALAAALIMAPSKAADGGRNVAPPIDHKPALSRLAVASPIAIGGSIKSASERAAATAG